MKQLYLKSLFLIAIHCLCKGEEHLTIQNNTDKNLKVDLILSASLDTDPLYDGEELISKQMKSESIPPNGKSLFTFDELEDLPDYGLEVSYDGIKKSYWLEFHYHPNKTLWEFSIKQKNGKNDLKLTRKHNQKH